MAMISIFKLSLLGDFHDFVHSLQLILLHSLKPRSTLFLQLILVFCRGKKCSISISMHTDVATADADTDSITTVTTAEPHSTGKAGEEEDEQQKYKGMLTERIRTQVEKLVFDSRKICPALGSEI